MGYVIDDEAGAGQGLPPLGAGWDGRATATTRQLEGGVRKYFRLDFAVDSFCEALEGVPHNGLTDSRRGVPKARSVRAAAGSPTA
jgi:hypothetical protein